VNWNDISTHQYDPVAGGIIEQVRGQGGKVLDCGAGLRSTVDDTVICLEVASFPTVDVIGVNQRLPFQNAVFDAVFSLNVLEHVTDPFTCASELVRVLKPGGTLYCCIPFLQPEHGYPHHYFNASRFGLRQLFQKNVELVDHFVPQSGEPIWTLHWFLTWYAKQLPLGEQQRFLNLRLQDVIEKPAITLLGEPWVSELSEEGKWQLASSTAALFRKT
jgi:SAM-dependent methyltransferase